MADKSQKADATVKAVERHVPTEFIWQVYADATLAGAAKLIPIPFVDLIVEEYFRRRMPRDIAWYNGRVLPPHVMSQINRRRSSNPLLGCMLLPFRAVFYLFRDIFRTVLYALSVADAADNMGFYWHRAFLLNYAIGQGHLDNGATVQSAMSAIDRAIAEVTTNPIAQLAQQVVINWKTQLVRLRTYVRFARKNVETQRLTEAKETMATAWGNYREYWLQVAAHYDDAFESAELYRQVKLRSTRPSSDEVTL